MFSMKSHSLLQQPTLYYLLWQPTWSQFVYVKTLTKIMFKNQGLQSINIYPAPDEFPQSGGSKAGGSPQNQFAEKSKQLSKNSSKTGKCNTFIVK